MKKDKTEVRSNKYEIADLINRLLLIKGDAVLYTNCIHSSRINSIFPGIEKREIKVGEKILPNSMYYLELESEKECCFYLEEKDDVLNYIVYAPAKLRTSLYLQKMQRCSLGFCGMDGDLYFGGNIFENCVMEVPRDFKVLAIIHCYNEIDIVERTMAYLLEQEIDLYMVDNWSTDGCYEKIVEMAKKYPNRIFYERFPKGGKTDCYAWYNQMQRTEEISCSMRYDWYMHYDADEIHISPWKELNLREAIYKVDQLGYNTIDNTVIDFKLTEQNLDACIFAEDAYFEFGNRVDHFMQKKTWKKSESVDLKSTGGHIVQIPNNKTFFLNFLNKHYPLRSAEQAERKIFVERKPRFEKEKNERGWHVHYDNVMGIKDIITDSSKCLFWGEETFDELYIPLFVDVGFAQICPEESEMLQRYYGKKIVIYGAGRLGEKLFLQLYRKCEIVAWIDKNYYKIKQKYFNKISSIQGIAQLEFDCCIIANAKKEIQDQIRECLKNMQISDKKIFVYPLDKE